MADLPESAFLKEIDSSYSVDVFCIRRGGSSIQRDLIPRRFIHALIYLGGELLNDLFGDK